MNWYGLIIASGIVICVIGAYFTAMKRGIEGDIVIDIILFCLPLAIFGARLYYVIFDIIDGGNWDFARFFGFIDGKFVGFEGLAIYGGLIGAVIGAILLWVWRNRKSNPPEKRISFTQLLDLGFTFIILGQAIGRWGNFANEEAHGYQITDPSLMWFPMGVEVGGSWYYATFFYESMWNVIGFVALILLYAGRYKSFDGFNLSLYCIYYGIGRAWIEGMRSDSLWLVPPIEHGVNGMPDVGGLRVSQLFSILLILFGVAYILQHIIRAKKAGKKIFIFVDRAKLSNEYFEYDKTKLAHPMPDLTPFYKKKKKSAREVEVDGNGVAIAVGDENETAAPPSGADAQSEVTNEKPNDGKDRSSTVGSIESAKAEEQYEDKWDD